MKRPSQNRLARGSRPSSRSLPRLLGRALASLLALMAFAAPAGAQQPPPKVEFSADHAVVEPEQGELSLQGHVRASCGRYRLRADRLRLAARDGGVDVDGPAEVTLCACPDAPVSIGFDRARVDPPSDIVLQNPSARIGGTTVAWLPVLWLRAPDRPGLLAPRVAWRGRDGLLLGPGFHLPWRNPDHSLSVLQLYVSGYTSGGFELDSRLLTPDSASRVRFDRSSGSLLAVESQGASGDRGSAVLAWSADVARGQRARSGWTELERSARRYDDARAHVSVQAGPATLATGIESAGRRAADARLSFGPTALVHVGGALGSSTAWQLDTSARMVDDGAALFDVLRADGRVDAGTQLGPVTLGLAAQARSLGVLGPDRSASDLSASSSLRGSLPLARRYGSAAAPWVHLVEPFVSGSVVGARTQGDVHPAVSRAPALGSGSRWIAQAGTRTAVGGLQRDRGASLQLGAGAVGAFDDPSAALPAAVSRTAVELGAGAFGSEFAAVLMTRRLGVAAVSFARLGHAESSHLRVVRAWRSELDPIDARSLALDDGAAGVSWLDHEGGSLASGATLALTHGFRLFGDSWWVVPGSGFLGARGGLGYRHPCGCVDASIQVARRQGREGTDGWLALDLAP